jgi:hypothetical protein
VLTRLYRSTKPIKSTINDTKVRNKYICTCSLSPPKTLTSTTKSSKLPQGSDDAVVGVACGGMVIVTVRDDGSHPLGIPGQQIVVEILHWLDRTFFGLVFLSLFFFQFNYSKTLYIFCHTLRFFLVDHKLYETSRVLVVNNVNSQWNNRAKVDISIPKQSNS